MKRFSKTILIVLLAICTSVAGQLVTVNIATAQQCTTRC